MRRRFAFTFVLAVVLILGAAVGSGAQPLPSIWVQRDFDCIGGEDWPPLSALTITVNDPETPITPDVETNAFTDAEGRFDIWQLGPPVEFQPGWSIAVTDGVTTKTHIVRDISITDADILTGIVVGTAPPLTEVIVANTLDGETVHTVVADSDGIWTSPPFAGELGVKAGAEFRVQQLDEDGDHTFVEWTVPAPATLQELLDDMVEDGRIPSKGIATSIMKQAEKAPLHALANHLTDLVYHGRISQETMDEIVALLHSGEGYALVKDGVLTVGTDPRDPPFEFMEDEEFRGFDIDLVAAVAERLGLDYTFVDLPFDSLIDTLADGDQIDMIAAAMTITPEREDIIDFSDPYIEDPRVPGDYYGFAFNESNPLLRDAVNDALAAMVADGTYDAIYENWF